MHWLLSSNIPLIISSLLFGLNMGYLMTRWVEGMVGYPLLLLIWSLAQAKLGYRWLHFIARGWAKGHWRIVVGGLLGALPGLLLWFTHPTARLTILPLGVGGALVGLVLPRTWRQAAKGALLGLLVGALLGLLPTSALGVEESWVTSPILTMGLLGAVFGGFLAIEWALRKEVPSSFDPLGDTPPVQQASLILLAIGVCVAFFWLRATFPSFQEPISGTALFLVLLLVASLLPLWGQTPHGNRQFILLRSALSYILWPKRPTPLIPQGSTPPPLPAPPSAPIHQPQEPTRSERPMRHSFWSRPTFCYLLTISIALAEYALNQRQGVILPYPFSLLEAIVAGLFPGYLLARATGRAWVRAKRGISVGLGFIALPLWVNRTLTPADGVAIAQGAVLFAIIAIGLPYSLAWARWGAAGGAVVGMVLVIWRGTSDPTLQSPLAIAAFAIGFALLFAVQGLWLYSLVRGGNDPNSQGDHPIPPPEGRASAPAS